MGMTKYPPKKSAILHLLFAIMVRLLTVVNCRTVADEEKLRSRLFSNYSVEVRPNATQSVRMYFVSLSLNELNIGHQRMSVTAVLLLKWVDYRLTWNPTLHGGVAFLRTSSDKVWAPVYFIENEMINVGPVGFEEGSPVRVSANGSLEWAPPVMMTTSCDVKISLFPYDTQNCHVIVTGLGDYEQEVNTSFGGFVTNYFTENGEWKLLETWTSMGYFTSTSGSYQRIYLHFRFRRRWQFYGRNLLLPLVLTSILMCAVFALPIESGEKMGFSLTVLLSYVVFLTWVTDNLPAVSTDASVLQVYQALVLCLGVLATLLTLWVLHLYHRDPERPLSPLMRFVANKILKPVWTLGDFLQKRKLFCKKSPSVQPLENEKVKAGLNRSQISLTESVLSAENLNAKWPQEVREQEVEENDGNRKFTWQEVAAMFDWLFLLFFSCAILFTNVVIIFVLNSGYL